MYSNNIGEVIFKKRKEAGLTQAQFAEHIGISKPAISKWESGYNMPDISMLPVLASYFDITIDELMGYHSQMTEERINELYIEFCDKLSYKCGDEIFQECREYINKYYFCYPLIFKISVLMYNHYTMSSCPESLLNEIIENTMRIQSEYNDSFIVNGAMYINACCNIQLKKYEDAEETLEKLITPVLNAPILLSFIYNENQKPDKAATILSRYVERNLVVNFEALPQLCLYSDESKFDEIANKTKELFDIFEAEKFYPSHLLRFYYILAVANCKYDKKDIAIKYLYKFIDLLEKTKLDFKSGRELEGVFSVGNSELIKEYFEQPPINPQMILNTIKEHLINNSSFESLFDNKDYIAIVQRLEAFKL